MSNERHAKQLAKVVPYSALEQLPEKIKDRLARLRQGLPTVLVMYYGGTLAMKEDSHGHQVPTDDAEQLLDPLLSKGLGDEMNVIWFPILDHAIDSTNGRWPHWVSLGNVILLLYDLIDGFVVIGGTDTKVFLVAALQYMFPNIGKPIICTGSQRSIFKQGDDATRNLYFALKAAISDLSGAHVAFADVLRHGLHTFKVKDRAFAAFDCPLPDVLGSFDGEVQLQPSAPRRSPIVNRRRLMYWPHFREGVKISPLSPATPSESILYDAKDPMCSALLLVTFGAGNVRNEGIIDGEITHLEAMKQLHEQAYPVVLGSPMMDGVVDSPYKTGADAVDPEIGGGISGGDTTGASLQVKMMRCLAESWDVPRDHLNYERFRNQMLSNLVGELTVSMRDPREPEKFSTKPIWFPSHPER